MTADSVAALTALRQLGPFEWSIVGQLAFVLYAYASAVRRGDLDAVVLGIGFWAVEFLWEMLNALVLHFSQHAPLWAVAGKSVLLIYVGLNLEISLMFAVLPLVLFQLLPPRDEERGQTLFGVPRRLLVPLGLGSFCVAVEIILNRCGVLIWTWPFWRWPQVWLILLAYCGPCIALCWIYDHVSLRKKTRGMIVAVVAALAAHLLFARLLGWI